MLMLSSFYARIKKASMPLQLIRMGFYLLSFSILNIIYIGHGFKAQNQQSMQMYMFTYFQQHM